MMNEDLEKELEKLADTWVVDGMQPFTGDDEMIARQNFKDDVGVVIKQAVNEKVKEWSEANLVEQSKWRERHLYEVLEALPEMATERKAISTDDAFLNTFGDKIAYNACLTQVRKIIESLKDEGK